MGRVRTKTVKRAAKEFIEKYYFKLMDDFDVNKKILASVSDVSSKRLRNKIAGYTCHLLRRLKKGPVKGISLKVQEEQHERALDLVTEETRVKPGEREVSATEGTLRMLSDRGFEGLITAKHVQKAIIVDA